jgi:dTDP-4-dehydrorhamnose reductase
MWSCREFNVHAADPSRGPIQVWGGIECTVNRVRDRYVDQLTLSGHANRADDISRIAGLGIRTIRYPILWERTAPVSPETADWSWADERMGLLATFGITPIVGLVHHGSGPHYTSLLDSSFVSGLAAFARAVAERYPQIRYVTPVNEPLTTARFSGLYGHWYPHKRSHDAFVRMLLNQCLAIRDSMAAMREVNSGIGLVQTEDLGRIYSTEPIRYQADYENERRWLTNDLLCGRVDSHHPMWNDLAVDTPAMRDLDSLATNPCPPDIVGVNYYVTSDRFLDDRLPIHDGENVEGNGRDRYADVEAARALTSGITGHSQVLTEAWERYRIPVALTEVHLGCTREHQMRWLAEAWKGANEARDRGCDIRAVTAWALFGSFGWDTLLTRPPYEYECGAFDVSGPEPRETGVARVIRQLVSAGECSEAVTEEPGWWESNERFTIAPYPPPESVARRHDVRRGRPRPILIAGASGTLGAALTRVCRSRGVSAVALSRREMDIADRQSVRRAISQHRPWAVINAAGFVRVDDAEEECASCYRANTVGVSVLATECAAAGIRLVTFSSDLVFDGRKGAAYVESDAVAPLNIYGSSKAAAERRALEAHNGALIVRTSAFFGPWDEYNFLAAVLKTLGTGIPFEAASDTVVSPTYVPDLANASLDLLMDGERGLWHLANQGEITWSDLAYHVADRTGLPAGMIRAVPSESLSRRAPQPRYSALASEKAALLPSLDNALDRWFSEASLPELRAVTA